MRWQKLYIVFLIPALFTACLESPDMTIGIVNGKEKPTVVTAPTVRVAPIPSDGNLIFQGEITSDGKADIIEKGFYWSTTSNDPGINDSIIQSTANTDTFKYILHAVSGEKTYYWRAYARNSFGYDYGEVDSCHTPDIWVSRAALPADSRLFGVVFTLNNKIYMTCGQKSWGGMLVSDTWEYSIGFDSWNQTDSISFPGEKRIYPTVFTIGNSAFIGTGIGPSTLYNDFYQFTATALTKTWRVIATPDDFEARDFANAFSLNGKGYVIGGVSAKGILNDVWQYDAGNNLWTKMGDFPVSIYGGISISNNNRSFAGFGGDTDDSKRTLWEYTDNDNWTVFATLPDEITSRIYSGVIIQNTIYMVDAKKTVWALNMLDKTWKEKAHLLSKFEGTEKAQNLLTTGNSNSIFIGLEDSNYLYEYRPLWDN